jgi:hypothetical protein
MRDSWRIGLVLGLTVLGGATVAYAQGGGHSKGGSSQSPAGNLASTVAGGGASASAPGDPLSSGVMGVILAPSLGSQPTRGHGSAGFTPTPGTSSSAYNRVRSIRREMVASSPVAAARQGGSSAGTGMMSSAAPLHPYSSQASPARAQQAASSRIPTSSSSHQQPPPPAGAPVMVRSTTHNYYPALRPAQHPNANAVRKRSPSRGQFLAGSTRLR